MKKKIKIGISACLLGNNCRYDGGNKLDIELKRFLEQHFELTPVCPEIECGMSVPREPANLKIKNGQKRFITLNSETDLTEKLVNWIEEKIKFLKEENLYGFVLKSKSPSCALHDARIYNEKFEESNFSFCTGLFAESIVKHFPNAVAEDENYLSTNTGKMDFLYRINGKRK